MTDGHTWTRLGDTVEVGRNDEQIRRWCCAACWRECVTVNTEEPPLPEFPGVRCPGEQRPGKRP